MHMIGMREMFNRNFLGIHLLQLYIYFSDWERTKYAIYRMPRFAYEYMTLYGRLGSIRLPENFHKRIWCDV
jgi:hypothetical protein